VALPEVLRKLRDDNMPATEAETQKEAPMSIEDWRKKSRRRCLRIFMSVR
jgi:hypothetical protein